MYGRQRQPPFFLEDSLIVGKGSLLFRVKSTKAFYFSINLNLCLEPVRPPFEVHTSVPTLVSLVRGCLFVLRSVLLCPHYSSFSRGLVCPESDFTCVSLSLLSDGSTIKKWRVDQKSRRGKLNVKGRILKIYSKLPF